MLSGSFFHNCVLFHGRTRWFTRSLVIFFLAIVVECVTLKSKLLLGLDCRRHLLRGHLRVGSDELRSSSLLL